MFQDTWVVASDSGRTPKRLPEKWRIFPTVLHEHFLQRLRPVQFIQNDWS